MRRRGTSVGPALLLLAALGGVLALLFPRWDGIPEAPDPSAPPERHLPEEFESGLHLRGLSRAELVQEVETPRSAP